MFEFTGKKWIYNLKKKKFFGNILDSIIKVKVK